MVAVEKISPTCLSLKEMWAGWEESAENAASDVARINLVDGDSKKKLPRVEFAETSSEAIEIGRQGRIEKMDLFRDVLILFLGEDAGEQRYERLTRELRGEVVMHTDLRSRMDCALKGKEEATKKFKLKEFKGAMYCYAVAWILLVPFYCEAFSPEDPLGLELAKLDTALWSNIGVMTSYMLTDGSTPTTEKPAIKKLGYEVARNIILYGEQVSAGILAKAYGRAAAQKPRKMGDPDDKEVKYYSAQEEKMKGIQKDEIINKGERVKRIADFKKAVPGVLA